MSGLVAFMQRHVFCLHSLSTASQHDVQRCSNRADVIKTLQSVASACTGRWGKRGGWGMLCRNLANHSAG